MQKRKYTHLKAVEGLILSMRQDGLTLQEIAELICIAAGIATVLFLPRIRNKGASK